MIAERGNTWDHSMLLRPLEYSLGMSRLARATPSQYQRQDDHKHKLGRLISSCSLRRGRRYSEML
jgi:hypothetical protein